MSVACNEHIDVDENGVARIAGHRTKVIQLVMDKMANDWTPEEIQSQYSYLSLAQIHAAFAYYYDHEAENRRHKASGQPRKKPPVPPLSSRLE